MRLLRSKAEDAAHASVHHASLSQQYMELSQKFAQLAEQADSTGLAELQQTLASLEGQVPNTTSETNTPARNSQPSDAPNKVPSPHFAGTATPTSDSNDGLRDEPSGVANPVSPTDPSAAKAPSKSKGGRRPKTRKLVERFRSAQPMAKRRVKIKAKKSDLKPKQRSAAEELKKGSSSIATSTLLFAVLVFLLSLYTWQLEIDTPLNPIMAAFASEVKPVEEPLPVEPPEEEIGEQTEEVVEDPEEEPEEEKPDEPEPEPEEEMEEPPAENVEAEMAEAPLPEVVNGTETAAAEATDAVDMASLNNRSDAGRKAMLQKFGGSAASENAVQLGLEWLLSVQHPQGYWDFVSVGPAGSAGTVNNPIGGTAYALLPFLAAGQTHKEGSYQKQVGAGLAYLASVGVNAPAGYDLRGMLNKQSKDKEPNEAYYVHGAATLALCEAYGMTNDRRLKKAAEGAVKFIVNSQDPRGGGWRYNPHDAGSTSVTAIQVMALVAAKKAGIKVPDATFKGVMHYLDSVQVDGEGRYGYEINKKKYTGAVTAMALLCRIYCGWGRNDGDMRAGIALLDKAGPYDNLYSLYFATQVMKNWGGAEWERWNTRFSNDLVAQQETEGPAKGSWKPRTGAIHAKQGGRLLTTALATLTLQVYYRYKPLLPEENGPPVNAAKSAD